MTTPTRFILLGAPALGIAVACSLDAGFPVPGGLGVTPGGSQDVGYARTLIDQGQVPARGEFSAEGLFSEHDLPFTRAPACDAILCPHAAVAVVDPVDGTGRGALVHIGFLTNIGDDFQRGPLDLALAVDISGSMSEGEKMPSTRQALSTLVAQLDADDTLSIVAFDDVSELRLTRTTMDEQGRAAALAVVDDLAPDGSTNIESGLLLAYQQLVEERTLGDGVPVARRVMLFTDAMPNVGATGEGEFTELVNDGAGLNIGLSAFGVGLDFGAALTDAIAKTRGGNAFYLKDAQTIATVFDADFDLIVTPLAYDLTARITRTDGVTLRRSYGAPTDDAAIDVDFGVSTLFLSRKNGGMGVVLNVPAELLPTPLPETAASPSTGSKGAASRALASFHLSYELASSPAAAPAARVEHDVDVAYHGGRTLDGTYEAYVEADDVGVYKMGVLVDEFLALEAAADGCSGALDMESAAARITEARDRMAARAGHLGDEPLAVEVELLTKLGENLASGSGCRAPPATE